MRALPTLAVAVLVVCSAVWVGAGGSMARPTDDALDGGGGDAFAVDKPTAERVTPLPGSTDGDDGVNATGADVPAGYHQISRLGPANATEFGRFGVSVDVNGDTAVVGRLRGGNGTGGSAAVFERYNGLWERQVTLRAGDNATGDGFGRSVAVDGDLAVVGARFAAVDGEEQGAVYVFRRANGTWTREARLAAEDGADGDAFGDAVAVTGDTVLVGAREADGGPGSAYTFRRSNGSWRQTAKLDAPDRTPADNFGWSVAIEGDLAVVGAQDDAQRGDSAGAVHAFRRANGTWLREAKLLANETSQGDNLGWSVGTDGDRVLAGANGAGDNTGAAYVFDRVGDTWVQNATLRASDGAVGDVFGFSVALDGGTALVGAQGTDRAGSFTGTAYAFRLTNGTWAEHRIAPDESRAGAGFGSAVAVDGATAFVGASTEDAQRGAAYAFEFASIYTREEIATAKYGPAFANLSDRTARQVEELYLRQPWPAGTTPTDVRTRTELAADRHDTPFDELSRERRVAVQSAFDAQSGDTGANATFDRDHISREKYYGYDFAALSNETSAQVEELFDRQPFRFDPDAVRTREEIARQRYDLPYDSLSRVTRIEIERTYHKQFADEN